MSSHRHRAARVTVVRWSQLLAAGCAALAVAAVVALLLLPGGSPPRVAAATGVVTPAVHRQDLASSAATLGGDPTLPALPPTPAPIGSSTTSPPVAVTIPSLGVRSGLEPLGVLANGTMQPPTSYGEAGWFSPGVVPGDVGPAVIVGHIDSYKGPGVFYRLAAIKPGATVTVTRADGSTLTFVVESVASYPKTSFPTDVVYAPTPTPELRLITCTGSFDRAQRSYRDNLVVQAVLAG